MPIQGRIVYVVISDLMSGHSAQLFESENKEKPAQCRVSSTMRNVTASCFCFTCLQKPRQARSISLCVAITPLALQAPTTLQQNDPLLACSSYIKLFDCSSHVTSEEAPRLHLLQRMISARRSSLHAPQEITWTISSVIAVPESSRDLSSG